MKSNELEKAVETRDAVEEIIEFVGGYGPRENGEKWDGCVELSFGAYSCKLSADVHADLTTVLFKQRTIYLKRLRAWGVDPVDDEILPNEAE